MHTPEEYNCLYRMKYRFEEIMSIASHAYLGFENQEMKDLAMQSFKNSKECYELISKMEEKYNGEDMIEIGKERVEGSK